MTTITSQDNPREQVTADNAGRQTLRVLHLIHGFAIGGAEKLLLEFARHTDLSRFDLEFVALGEDGAVAEDLRASGFSAHALGVPLGLRPRLLAQVVQLLRHQQIDVLHTHDDRACIYGAAATLFAPVRRLIHTRHGQSQGLSKRQRLLVKWLSRRVDRFACVSDNAAELSLAQGVPADRVTTIRNGIDVRRFAYGHAVSTGPILCVARLSPEKDVENLIRALALTTEEAPELRLEIGGDGPCRGELKRLVRELGIADKVHFHGQVSDIPQLLRHASMFVLPSRSEGIPLTILEAQASGVPVIATNVGGVPEVITEGVTGRLVPPQQPTELARAILELWSDLSQRQSLAAAARVSVEQQFDVRRMVGCYEELYVPVSMKRGD